MIKLGIGNVLLLKKVYYFNLQIFEMIFSTEALDFARNIENIYFYSLAYQSIFLNG